MQSKVLYVVHVEVLARVCHLPTTYGPLLVFFTAMHPYGSARPAPVVYIGSPSAVRAASQSASATVSSPAAAHESALSTMTYCAGGGGGVGGAHGQIRFLLEELPVQVNGDEDDGWL